MYNYLIRELKRVPFGVGKSQQNINKILLINFIFPIEPKTYNISDLFFSFQSSNNVYNAPMDITKKLNFDFPLNSFIKWPRKRQEKRRNKNLKIKKSKKNFIQEKYFDFEIFISSLKNAQFFFAFY
ncbi:hypothetical protein BpHYR1_053265 [Brachionus plicatilis]|uniref:Uncharacterized protein n=1 Tax=Brachionus plicatilis TaxID=10195 RepID=A0A3M7T1R0_BRAPC|nr:hypothetical protein BpHYR1_053265 [Brachionus plicatilis]